MENITSILLVVQVLLSISLIVLILMQHGKGADAGAAFGSGASATVFGARGSGNFMTRATTIIAILFFVVCLALAYVSSNRVAPESVTGSVMSQDVESAPMQQADDMPPLDDAGAATQESDLPPASYVRSSCGVDRQGGQMVSAVFYVDLYYGYGLFDVFQVFS